MKREEAKTGKKTRKKNRTGRTLPRVLPGNYSYHTRNTDRQMHRQKHAGSGRKYSSRIQLTIEESHPIVHDERNGTARRWNKNIRWTTIDTRLEDTNQQLKKWPTRWKPVIIDHSMKRVKEIAQANSKPIWKHSTANKPVKTRVSRKLSTRKHVGKIRMTNNPLTNVYNRMQKKRSSSRVVKATTRIYKKTDLISQMYTKLGKHRSTSRDKAVLEVEEQEVIKDRFGDIPM
jgi:hypothetical protein